MKTWPLYSIDEINEARVVLSELSLEEDGITGKQTDTARAAQIAVAALGEYALDILRNFEKLEDDVPHPVQVNGQVVALVIKLSEEQAKHFGATPPFEAKVVHLKRPKLFDKEDAE